MATSFTEAEGKSREGDEKVLQGGHIPSGLLTVAYQWAPPPLPSLIGASTDHEVVRVIHGFILLRVDIFIVVRILVVL